MTSHRDAHPERTVLAWVRTALSLAGAGLVCVRLAPSDAAAVVGAVVVCGAAALLISHVGRLRPSRPPPQRPPAEPGGRPAGRDATLGPGLAVLTTAITMAIGVLGLVLAFG